MPTTDIQSTLLRGNPVFADQSLEAIKRERGLEAAWRACLAGRPAAEALRGVSGAFAVAIELDDGRTVLAVDRFAIHTLCYRMDAGRMRFAERADALGSAAGGLDPQAIFDYLFFHAIPSPRTIFDGVRRLPAAHVASCIKGQLDLQPYWRPIFNPGPTTSFADLRERFLAATQQAVADQLDGSKPACFLSGGTDSSTVAGMIGRVTGQPASTFSIGFEAEGYDEMAFARLTARHFGTDHHEYYVTPDDLVRHIPTVAAHHDQPFGNSSALPAYCCGLVARDAGVTRVLAGDGGDELFGGNTRYAKQRIFGWYGLLPNGLRRAVMEPFFGLPAVAELPLLKKGSSYIEQARVPMPDRLQMYNLLRRLGMPEVLSPALLSRVDIDDPQRQQRAVYQSTQASTEIDRMLAFDWRYTLAESDLPKVRGSAEMAGIEVGFPLLSPALLDLALELPANYKLRGLKLRWFFKEALRGFLPDATLTKKKQGFGLPFGPWAVRHDALRRLAVDSLRSLAQRGLVQPGFVRDLIDTHLPAHPGYYGEMVWILMMLEQWLQAHAPEFELRG